MAGSKSSQYLTQASYTNPPPQHRDPSLIGLCDPAPPPPPLGRGAVQTFGEVSTLFHETGHGLQAMLTTVREANAAGTHTVEWDAVELPPGPRPACAGVWVQAPRLSHRSLCAGCMLWEGQGRDNVQGGPQNLVDRNRYRRHLINP